MNPRLAGNATSMFYCAVIVVLAVALVWLSYTAADNYMRRDYLASEERAHEDALVSLRAKKAELERARRFMANASEFVAKADQLGIRSIHNGQYRVDYNKVISLQKMPAVLLQARNEDGRYFLPESLSIARAGFSLGKDQSLSMSNALKTRANDYQLAFVGDVFIVNDEN